jgi:hypothetical protein
MAADDIDDDLDEEQGSIERDPTPAPRVTGAALWTVACRHCGDILATYTAGVSSVALAKVAAHQGKCPKC